MIGVAPELRSPRLDVGVERLRIGKSLVRCENRLRILTGKRATVVGRTGLHQHRVSLRRSRCVERSPHPKMPADVVDLVNLVSVRVDSVLPVQTDRVVLPAVPQPHHRVDEFPCTRIPVAVVRMLGQPEVGGSQIRTRGDDVPPSASVRDVVERGEQPSQVVRLVVRGRRRRDQSDPLGCHCNGRQQGDRLQRPCGTVLDVAAQRGTVGEEDSVELRRLSSASDLLEIRDVEQTFRGCPRMTPRRFVMTGGVDERVEAQLARRIRHA